MKCSARALRDEVLRPEIESVFAENFEVYGARDWSNHRRLLEPIGNIRPAEAEERYYVMLGEQQMAA